MGARVLTKRRRISTKDRVALFMREGGICHMCGGLVIGKEWDVSHEIPLELGGADDETNWKVAHRKCHRDHTANVDIPNIARAKRREARNIGAMRPKQTITSRGFASSDKPAREPKPRLPPRPMFVD